MNLPRLIVHRLRALFRKEKLDAEMAEEMRHHLDAQMRRNLAAGLSFEDAHYAARRSFGGVEQIKERVRDERGWMWLDLGLQSVRHAGRQLRRSPAFTIATVFTLALGIGACSAIFTVVNSILLRPIALPESDRLMVLQESHPRYPHVAVSPANFRAWAEQADLFESMAVRTGYSYNLVGGGEPVRAMMAGVTGRYFEMLRVRPAHGRLFGPAEDAPGKSNVVVLTHAFWQRQFGGRAEVIGSPLHLSGELFTVIGVFPAEFRSGEDELFTPLGVPGQMWEAHGRFFSRVVGRLKPGVTVEQARAQMNALAARAAEQFPTWNKGWAVHVTPLLDFETRAVQPTFYALLAAVAALLLIACTNIANLALVRATARQREISVRAALGASRARLAGQLLTESLVLAVLSGLLGLVVAKWSVHALLALAPFNVPRAEEIALDGRAVAFTFAITLLTGVAVGLVPAWCCARRNLVEVLKGSDRHATDGRGARLFRDGLVVAQVALALALLTASGVLIRSFVRLARASPGFLPENALVLEVQPQHRTAEKQIQFAEALDARIRTLPGVTSVAASFPLPFAGDSMPHLLEIERTDVPFNARPGTIHFRITPEYFQAMGIPLVRGRAFAGQDRAGALPVAIISQSLAERFFPNVDPIGRRIRWDGYNRETWRTIVGVVGDVRPNGFDRDIVPQLYEPFAQAPSGIVNFVVRAASAPAALAPLLRRELHAIEPELPVFRLEALEQLVANSIARQRFAMGLFSVFSGVALLLAATGIYGVTACAVAQRGREFGIRLALGAQASDLRRLVLIRGVRLVGTGLVAGAVCAWFTTRLIESLLYQTPARAPVVFIANAALIASIALAACLLPARRAAKIDPMLALRSE